MPSFLTDLWTGLSPVHAQLYSLGFSLIGSYVIWALRARVRLIWGQANVSRDVLKLQDGPLEIFVQKFFLQNAGKKPATNVEFILSGKPSNISVFQPRDSQEKELADGDYVIQIPFIAPGELVVIDCVYLNQAGSFVSSVKCSEAIGKNVLFWTVRKFPKWFEVIIAAVMLFGVAYIFQFIFAFLGAG